MVSPETLRRFSLFAGFDASLLKELAMISEEVTLQKGDWIFHEGDTARALYLIFSGQVGLKISTDENGERHSGISELVAGDFVGWSALLTEPHVYTLGAAASSEVEMVKLDADGLQELIARHPAAGYQLMHRLAQGIARRLRDLRIQFVSLVES